MIPTKSLSGSWLLMTTCTNAFVPCIVETLRYSEKLTKVHNSVVAKRVIYC